MGGVTLGNDLKAGRKLLDYRIGYGFPEGTGSKTIQVRAGAVWAALSVCQPWGCPFQIAAAEDSAT